MKARMICRGEAIHPPMELVDQAVVEFNQKRENSLEVFGETNPKPNSRLLPENITHIVGRMERSGDEVIVSVHPFEEPRGDVRLVIRTNVKYSEFDYIEGMVFLTVDMEIKDASKN